MQHGMRGGTNSKNGKSRYHHRKPREPIRPDIMGKSTKHAISDSNKGKIFEGDQKYHSEEENKYFIHAHHSNTHQYNDAYNPVKQDKEMGDAHTKFIKGPRFIEKPYKQSKPKNYDINGYGKKRSLSSKTNEVWRDIRKLCYNPYRPHEDKQSLREHPIGYFDLHQKNHSYCLPTKKKVTF